jgi:hypothetical protein
MGLLDYHNFLTEGKKSSASSGLSYDAVPEEYKKAAATAKKEASLEGFWNNLPEGEGKSELFNYLNSNAKNSGKVKLFIDGLWTKKQPSDVSPSDYKGGVGSELFALKPAGMGRGELFLGWLLADSKTQGGSVNFDLELPGGKFEVKDYRNPKNAWAPIRLGAKGKAPQFDIWTQITETLTLLTKMKGDGQKYDFDKAIGDKELVSLINKMLNRKSTILTGEFNKTDLKNFTAFYEKVSTMTFTPNVFVKAILRGPGGEPMEFNIEPLDIETAKKESTITLKKGGDISTADSVLAELRRLTYARDPKKLSADLQKTVNMIVGDIPFIIFRNDGINITKDFVFVQVSQSGVVIVERSVAERHDKDVNPEDAIDVDSV